MDTVKMTMILKIVKTYWTIMKKDETKNDYKNYKAELEIFGLTPLQINDSFVRKALINK